MAGLQYQELDAPYFDYEPYRLKGLGDQYFRGPPCDRTQPHVVCVGAAQTFGRFSAAPYPWQLSLRLGVEVLSLAVGGKGPGFFNRPEYLKTINAADIAVVQVLSGRSASNSRFDNSGTGGLLGIRRSDGKRMRFEQFLTELMREEPHETVAEIVEETRAFYLSEMEALLDQIEIPTVLLWVSEDEPRETDDFSDAGTLMGRFPQLVNRTMVDRLAAKSDQLVRVTGDPGLPQALWPVPDEAGGGSKRRYNRYYPSPQKHAAIARELSRAIPPLAPPRLRERIELRDAAQTDEPGVAIVVGRRSDATSLLRSMLNQHPGVRITGHIDDTEEVSTVDDAQLPDLMHRRLSELRETDPRLFLRALLQGGSKDRLVGFAIDPESLAARDDLEETLSRRQATVVSLGPLVEQAAVAAERISSGDVLEVDLQALARSPHATAADVLARLGIEREDRKRPFWRR